MAAIREEEPCATVLIVDDSPENLTVLGELLSAHYRVRVANSGYRALEIAASEPRPEIILLDVMMPGMDGFEVLARLRQDARTRHIPVIFVTAMDGGEEEERGLAQGAVDYITKPPRPPVVLARVRTHLDLKHARDCLANQNASLEEEVKKRVGEILLTQEVGIHALARLAEIRDPDTGNHLRRTQGFVRELAIDLREHPRFRDILAPGYIDDLVRSAPLHDIGKVGIPDHILLKPGKLDPDEWEIMKTHARLGSDAIELAERDTEQPVEFLAVAKEIAHFHHERWDGHGYPAGLREEAIPLPARLMALADVFDALTSRRAYKLPLDFETARATVAEGRGTHFDPDVTDAFLRNYENFTRIALRFAENGQGAGAGASAPACR